MSEQATPPPDPEPGDPPGSRIERLRRNTSNEVISGVASGLGREFGIDALLVRVAFVIATFVGGAGFVMYAACWMLIPKDGNDISPLGHEFKATNDLQFRILGLALGAGLALAAALGSTPWVFGTWSNQGTWLVATIAVTVGIVYWFTAVNRGTDTPAPAAPPATSNNDSTPVPFAPPPSGSGPSSSAAHTDPESREPKPKPEPGRSALFMLTFSTGAIVLGSMALWSMVSEPFVWTTYVAVAIGIVAIGTLVGVRWGNPGPLLGMGVLLSVVLIIGSGIPSASVGSVNLEPQTVAEISEPVRLGVGEIIIDLRDISPESPSTGHTWKVQNGIGNVEIIVPQDLDVSVDARVRIGQVSVFGAEEEGAQFSAGRGNEIQVPSEQPGALHLDVSTTIGEVKVTRP